MSAAATTRTRRRWPRWVPITLWSVLGILGAAFLLFLLTIMFGAVHGREFSPQTFERRSYSFFELPLVGIQVTAKKNDDVTGTTETTLKSDKHITPLTGPQDWHIIVGSRGLQRLMRKGDASILMQYLDARDADEDFRWAKWSQDNPKLAAVLWPAVQRLALHELYIFIPDLFEIARAHDDPAKLQQAIDQLVAEKLLFLARRLQEAENRTAAVEVLDEAVTLFPDNQEIARARDTARVAAGAK